MAKFYKADLHVHSRHSNKPSIWALRKFNCPESYTSPMYIYNTAKKRGMDYVTITDHNSINGALEIAHLPGTFISTEITTYLPDDGSKLHTVALDINEDIFKDLMHLRTNIYDLVGYLQKNNITHYIAHPLYDMNERLSVATIEKLLLLFEVFETKNGSRARRYGRLIANLLSSLTPQKMDQLANKHGIVPYGERPWIKSVVAGSDDHSGFFIGRAYTASNSGGTIKDFINSIREQKTWAAGDDGDALTLAHSIYGIGYRFFKERFETRKGNSFPFINALLNKVFNGTQSKSSLFDRINLLIRKNIPEIYSGYDGKTFEEILDREARLLLNDARFLQTINSSGINRKVFAVTSYLANRLIYIYTERLTRMQISNGVLDIANSLSTIGFVHLLTSPYYVSFHHQHRSKHLIKALEDEFLAGGKARTKQKIALFTDTLHEINGVAITIKRLIKTARKQGIEFTVITSTHEETGCKDGVMNFKSVGDFALPEYPDLTLHFPPILDIIDYFEKEEFTRIHASTPGTLGLLALFIAKLMNIPISGTYHTDIPQYVKSLTNDTFLENVAWNYMIWFYNLMEEVMVPSSSTRQQLIQKGLIADKAKPLPRWVDTDIFSPAKKDPYLWRRYGLGDAVKFLYVGRVSKEKNLEILARAFKEVVDSGNICDLIIAGDGPYKNELEKLLEGYPVLFTGFLSGDELHTTYASADVFLFPSTTDTFGNVVLEAQASGLPVIVSDEGGPKELIINGKTGLVVEAHSSKSLIDAMTRFLNNRRSISEMGMEARYFTENNGIRADQAYSTILRSDFITEDSCTAQENNVRV
ncbi:MAG: glycosyltransferase [Nitrospirae bacterium]|nr:glycosyltransferase [Nitrospirota bacterium]